MRVAYVIMPVASDPSHADKREVIEMVARDCGFSTYFPLDASQPFFLRDTLARIESASVVIADLSLERPSCYYELGLAQALNKYVILLATLGTPIHQTADRQSVRFYDGLDSLRSILMTALKAQKR